MPRKTLTTRQHKRISIELPPEFIALCSRDNVPPEGSMSFRVERDSLI